MNAGALQIDRIRAELRTRRIGRCIEYVDSTTSTNDEAWQHVEAGDADGLVVFAEHQSAGRGRFGRTWHSPRGASLLCSVAVLDTDGREEDSHGHVTGSDLVLLAGVAACDAVEAATALVPVLRWPNDLIMSGRKLGGILIESRTPAGRRLAHVLGIGINCLQQTGHFDATLRETATSLEMESTQPVDRTALAVMLLTELDRWLAEPRSWETAELRSQWLHHAGPMGQRVCLQHAGCTVIGTIVDLDPSAALVVRLDEGGIRLFDAATTTLVRPQPGAVGRPERPAERGAVVKE